MFVTHIVPAWLKRVFDYQQVQIIQINLFSHILLELKLTILYNVLQNTKRANLNRLSELRILKT